MYPLDVPTWTHPFCDFNTFHQSLTTFISNWLNGLLYMQDLPVKDIINIVIKRFWYQHMLTMLFSLSGEMVN